MNGIDALHSYATRLAQEQASPGMVMTEPVSTTTNPAPADTDTSLTFNVNPSGLPRSVGSSDREYCVFAIQTGSFPNPSSSNFFNCFTAAGA